MTTVSNCKMIDALIYGMMPSAKIVKRDNAPPEKISRKPRSAPPSFKRNLPSSSLLMPGVGMCAPMRYTANIPNVKRIRVRSSGIWKMFLMLVISRSSTAQNLYPPSGGLNLGGGGLAEPMRLHVQRSRQHALGKHFNPRSMRRHQSALY